ncbi:MAG TPA: hypothetical protein VI485_28460 [Vicinamibacterales bacterium]|nr:hypothetical protein [Vicinamibacterales bacterium]
MKQVLSATAMLMVAIGIVATDSLVAQGPPPPQGRPASPWAAAPIDLTGYWVSIVNEDWRWRMVTPPKGDVASVPLNPEGTKIANSWDPATDGSCLAYGAAGLMRIPTRLHITWENEQTVKIETDAGQQTRRLTFDKSQAAPSQRSLQGYSVAEWELAGGGGRGAPQGPRSGNLKVATTMLSGGWLRKNGVPYSENATLTEYFDRFAAPNGDEWLVVTTVVSDPKYLNQDFVTSTHFKREPSAAKWSPAACKA